MLRLEKTLQLKLSLVIPLMMGTVSAVFGGVLRDILVNRIPLILRREINATACMAGGLIYLVLKSFFEQTWWPMLISIAFVIVLRRFAVMKKWALPLPKWSLPDQDSYFCLPII